MVQGLDRLTHLTARAQGRISILPGGGVSEANAAALVRTTRVTELHLSAGVTTPGGMESAHPVPQEGGGPGEDELRVTDPGRVRRVLDALR